MTSHKKQKSNISYVGFFVLVWKAHLESSSTLQNYFRKLEFYASVQTEFPPCVHMHYTKAINYF